MLWYKKRINKKAKKKVEGKCFFCPVDNYACLQAHRILPEEKGGIYDDFNVLVICANCHTRIHANPPQIVIDRKYMSTNQRGWTLHFWENGEEKWL